MDLQNQRGFRTLHYSRSPSVIKGPGRGPADRALLSLPVTTGGGRGQEFSTMVHAQSTEEQQRLARIWHAWHARDARAAVAQCQSLNQAYPESAEGWFASSFVALQLGGAQPALQFIDQALRIRPAEPAWLLHKARCLQACHARAKAIALLEELGPKLSGDASLLAEAGLLASQLNQQDRAAGWFAEALKAEPDNARLHYNLASIQRFLGDLEAAEASANRAIALNPGEHDAWLLRSSLRKWDASNHHIGALRASLEQPGNQPLAEAMLCYALGKELEDLGEYAESFASFERGARARRSVLQYDVSEDEAFIEAIIEVYDAELLHNGAEGHVSREPIFILGLPRTGTTLVERILGSHDEVISAGELTQFTRLIAARAQQGMPDPAADLSRPDMVRLTAGIDFRELGRAYIESTRPETGYAPRFIDKFPANTLNVGAIHKALPEARIVLLERHPMASCFSMYKALFTEIYPFSYNFEELGRYFIAHQRLLKHWLEALPGRIHRVRYEQLVCDPEAETRLLLEYCGLPWQDTCLAFQDNPQASTTASASQVRQGIYSSSVDTWRHHAERLAPLEKMLREAGCLDDWPE
jgi:tetratricopeptide (TPR) repeat protein